jgi:hypothetical protein
LLQRPDQRDHLSNRRPPKKEIENKDGYRVTLASRDGNDRRKKIQYEAEAKNREEENAKRCMAITFCSHLV